MKRFLSTLSALLLMLLGVGLAALGGLGIAVFGTTGSTTAAATDLESSKDSAAIVADLAGVEVGIPLSDRLGKATLTVTGSGGKAMFVGTAEQAAVDNYLFGVPYDLATKDGSWSTTPVPGTETVMAPPDGQDFWTTSASGPAPVIELDVAQPQTLVLMNADGTAGVSATTTVGFSGDNIFWYSIAAITAGILLLILATTILVRGRRKRRRAAAPPASGVVDLSATRESTAVLAEGRADASAADPAASDGPAV